MATVRIWYAEYLPQTSHVQCAELLRLRLVQEGRAQAILHNLPGMQALKISNFRDCISAEWPHTRFQLIEFRPRCTESAGEFRANLSIARKQAARILNALLSRRPRTVWPGDVRIATDGQDFKPAPLELQAVLRSGPVDAAQACRRRMGRQTRRPHVNPTPTCHDF